MIDREGQRAITEKEGESARRAHHWLYVRDLAWIDANVPKGKRSFFVRNAVRQTIRALEARRARDGKP